MDGLLVLNGTAQGPRYVCRAIGTSGMVTWTTCRAGAMRFYDRQSAEALREAIVTRYGIAAAVVPDRV